MMPSFIEVKYSSNTQHIGMVRGCRGFMADFRWSHFLGGENPRSHPRHPRTILPTLQLSGWFHSRPVTFIMHNDDDLPTPCVW